MTNKEDEHDEFCDPRIAALWAVHLVSQVLDEAYVIANAANESGRPWRDILMLKSLRNSSLDDMDGENILALTASKSNNSEPNRNTMDSVVNVVATSTPQKTSDQIQKLKNELFYVGQGDEDVEIQDPELNNSTSMFINQMFDMSEVERVIFCEDGQISQGNNDTIESNDSVAQAMAKIMESYVNFALDVVFKEENKIDGPDIAVEKSPKSTEHSSYSVLADACVVECDGEVAFCIHDDAPLTDEYAPGCSQISPNVAGPDTQKDDNIEKNDIGVYENAYSTLNRDYEQYSDDDDGLVFEDPKMLSLQEVELLTAPSPDDSLSSCTKSLKKHKEAAVPKAVSESAFESRKSSFVRRWRLQGVRLLACLQGWWRRKTPGKRKNARTPGTVRGLCPLSPDARRRAVSLLDQRQLCSPSPSHSIIWKFNTVNEALVNSSRWKDYAFETKHDGTDHYEY